MNSLLNAVKSISLYQYGGLVKYIYTFHCTKNNKMQPISCTFLRFPLINIAFQCSFVLSVLFSSEYSIFQMEKLVSRKHRALIKSFHCIWY